MYKTHIDIKLTQTDEAAHASTRNDIKQMFIFMLLSYNSFYFTDFLFCVAGSIESDIVEKIILALF